jgi:tetratricopeptide (TPR) repeat protein
MRRLTFRVAFLVVFLILTAAGLMAQAGTAPSWLLYEQGKTWAAQGEFGKALQFYKDAILAAGVMPEADAAIGDVYREEGEFQLAERQYTRAYNLRNALVIPDEKYDILNKWAGLYEDQELYSLMESKLLMIVAEDRWNQGEQLPIQVERNYVDKGLDHVLALYRFDSRFATSAHSRLGWFYYRTGRYPQAVRHLLYAVILQVSEVADFLKQKDPDVAVTGLESFFASALRDAEVRAWFAESGLASDLYYLSASAWELGHPLRAQAVWKTLSSLKEAGKYADLSGRQLVKPFREPFLEPVYRLQTNP